LVWTGLICLRIGTGGGLCEHGNELSSSTKCLEILEWSSYFSRLALFFLAYFPYFEKVKIGLEGHLAMFLCVYPLLNFLISEPVFMKLGMYIMLPEPISTAYVINPSSVTPQLQSLKLMRQKNLILLERQ
jgi:hypothetical protein